MDDDGDGDDDDAGGDDVFLPFVAFFHKLFVFSTSAYRKQSQVRNLSKHNQTKIRLDGGCRNVSIYKFY